MTRATFWMVHGTGPSTVRHHDLESARREAKRLAKKHPDTDFFVLQAMDCYVKREVERIEVADPDFDQVPF